VRTDVLRVLLTNDDGIRADGLRVLAEHLAAHSSVLVVAPDRPNSATSHSITLHKPLRLDEEPGLAAAPSGPGSLNAYSCSGTPSDCVMLGALQVAANAPPHLVISGMNDGMNVAQDLTYSGTVGGALEGAVLGIPSMSVSLVGTASMSFADAAAVVDLLLSLLLFNRLFPWHDSLAGRLRHRVDDQAHPLRWAVPQVDAGSGEEHYPEDGHALEQQLGTAPCFNVNIPDVPLDQLRGLAWTRAGRREYSDIVKRTLDPRGRPYYWIAGEKLLDDEEPGTDVHAIKHGLVSVTPITYDLTSVSDLARLVAGRGNALHAGQVRSPE